MIGRFLARGCFVAALSLTSFGCARADNAAEPSNAAAEMLPLPEILRGREITRVSPPAPPDALAQETFACDGRWAGQGRGGRSGVYWAEGENVCVRPLGGAPFCRHFVSGEEGAIQLMPDATDGEPVTYSARQIDQCVEATP